jgi:hypothetical protein
VPVFLWENRGTQLAVAIERNSPEGYSLWREPEQGAVGNVTDRTWLASAAHDSSTLVGTAYRYSGTCNIGVDDVSTGSNVTVNNNGQCPSALTAYRRADAGLAFLGISPAPLQVVRACPGASPCLPAISGQSFNGQLFEAVTDDSQTSWFSAWSSSTSAVVVMSLPRDGTSLTSQNVAGLASSTRVFLSTSGTQVHAGWVLANVLYLSEVNLDGGSSFVIPVQLGEPARLVDLVEGPRTVVTVLDYAGRTAFHLRDRDGGAQFVRLDTPLDFQPTVAHLGSRLRVAGLCDGGCMGPNNNGVLEFATLPDGGPW